MLDSDAEQRAQNNSNCAHSSRRCCSSFSASSNSAWRPHNSILDLFTKTRTHDFPPAKRWAHLEIISDSSLTQILPSKERYSNYPPAACRMTRPGCSALLIREHDLLHEAIKERRPKPSGRLPLSRYIAAWTVPNDETAEFALHFPASRHLLVSQRFCQLFCWILLHESPSNNMGPDDAESLTYFFSSFFRCHDPTKSPC